ncbi:hypothetical protein PMAYCL1PPCAC_18961, partial [Pristionchus mayeri]
IKGCALPLSLSTRPIHFLPVFTAQFFELFRVLLSFSSSQILHMVISSTLPFEDDVIHGPWWQLVVVVIGLLSMLVIIIAIACILTRGCKEDSNPKRYPVLVPLLPPLDPSTSHDTTIETTADTGEAK